jgi:anti-sigma factor RsiW
MTMACEEVQSRLSALQDEIILDSERRALLDHIGGCGACAERYQQHLHLRQSLRALPRPELPRRVAVRLRIEASRAASRRRRYAGINGFLKSVTERFNLFVNNLMRPLALPVVGGLFSTIVLFSAVITNLRGIDLYPAHDVPTIFWTDAALIGGMTLPVSADELVVDVVVDEYGRVVDYSLPTGSGSIDTPQLRRNLENSLLLAEFEPATSFGQPTTSRLRVTFRRSAIDVKG